MRTCLRVAALFLFLVFFAVAIFPISSFAQAGATSGTVTGTVTDPSGAVVAGATVSIENPVSEFRRSVMTDGAGSFTFVNVPFNPYHLTVSGSGFSSSAQDVDVQMVNGLAAFGPGVNDCAKAVGQALFCRKLRRHREHMAE